MLPSLRDTVGTREDCGTLSSGMRCNINVGSLTSLPSEEEEACIGEAADSFMGRVNGINVGLESPTMNMTKNGSDDGAVSDDSGCLTRGQSQRKDEEKEWMMTMTSSSDKLVVGPPRVASHKKCEAIVSQVANGFRTMNAVGSLAYNSDSKKGGRGGRKDTLKIYLALVPAL